MEPMRPIATGAPTGAAGVGVEAPRPCALCGRPVAPDGLGFLECRCGWGGPGDPLEAMRGPRRGIARADRRLADALARRDLARLPDRARASRPTGPAYTAVLLLASTVAYAFMLALFGLMAWLTVSNIQGHVWAAAVLWGLVTLYMLSLVWPRGPRPKGVEATPARFPRLAAAVAEVGARVGAPAPDRVILVPGAEAYVFQHRPPRRFFRRELVMGLGAGALPLLSERDLKAIMAHELAHLRHGDTALHRYFAGAEAALWRFIDTLVDLSRREGRPGGGYRARRYGGRSTIAGGAALGSVLVVIITLPVGVLWFVFHLLRMAESRAAEFAADRVAATAYGPQAFADGLTGLIVAGNTLRGASSSLVAEMRRQGGANLYAALRQHYAGLPADVIVRLRQEAARGFRALEHSHPITPDRLRAVTQLGLGQPAAEPWRPAVGLLAPAGAGDAEAVERELTALLLR